VYHSPKWAPLADRAYWTEIRSYKHYMVIGSELEGNGIQIFDMTKLLDLTAEEIPKKFTNEDDLTGHWDELLPIGSTHNVVVNEEKNYGVAVGARPRDQGCFGGLHFFSLDDPSNPETLGCNGEDGYVHDAQCLIYRGPHEKYQGKDICYGYNEDTLTIYDVTNKANSTIISRTSYTGAAYTHQGWLNDPNWQEFLFMDDEYDEYDVTEPALDGYPVT
jgi:choice-of-anchor B domain-containing protein